MREDQAWIRAVVIAKPPVKKSRASGPRQRTDIRLGLPIMFRPCGDPLVIPTIDGRIGGRVYSTVQIRIGHREKSLALVPRLANDWLWQDFA